MEIGDWTATRDLNDLFRQLRDLDLLENIAELDAFGFTIVPPEKTGAGDLVQRLTARILQIAEQRTGFRPDVEAGEVGPDGRSTEHLYYLLFEDPVFQEALLNPAALSLISYLLGNSCRVSSVTSILKGPGTEPLRMHADMQNVPAPFPTYAQVANATFLLSDYTKDNGALCFTPGSHRLCRAPGGEAERNPIDNPKAVPVEAPAGSLVVWHGNTWHGAFPRINPGLRMNLIMYFCRVYIREQEPYIQHLDPQVLETLPDRLRTLLGEREPLGWREEGPQFDRFITRAGASLHG